jgi:transcriptional regulator with XRE-family HTH domain
MKKLTPTDIKVMLLKKGIKQKELAEALGVTESYVSQIIKGKRVAKKYRDKLLEIAQKGLGAKIPDKSSKIVRNILPTEIIFLVEEDAEGGYVAKALGYSIFTQAESIEELKEKIKDALKCHFDDEAEIPPTI